MLQIPDKRLTYADIDREDGKTDLLIRIGGNGDGGHKFRLASSFLRSKGVTLSSVRRRFKSTLDTCIA